MKMIQQIFSVFDEKANAYLPPFYLPEIGMAKRTFQDCVNSESHAFGKHPEDYTLLHMGEFDDTSGAFSVFDKKVSLGLGVEYKTVVDLPLPGSQPTE